MAASDHNRPGSGGNPKKPAGAPVEKDHPATPTPTEATVEGKEITVFGPTTASIVQIYGEGIGRRFVLDGRTVIGRERSASVVVDLSSVSRRHAELFERGGAWWIVDLGSTNGTFLSGSALRGETRLTSGDILQIGGAVFKYLAGGNIEALYYEEIFRLSITDGLTGIHNKRYFLDQIRREVARARRKNRPLWVAMLDIDHFKRFNDTYGHVTGDHILRGIAGVLATLVRADETLARYGGEEFVFLLVEAENAEVEKFCERIRSEVERQEFVFDGVPHHLTVSMGAARLRPGQEVEDLVRAADTQLYRAKEEGRNRAFVEGLETSPSR